ncbi:MAG: ATP-binding protein [Chloroflexi bacterium]|nr:ATP-binding protein [Chloroflexota bacterium]
MKLQRQLFLAQLSAILGSLIVTGLILLLVVPTIYLRETDEQVTVVNGQETVSVEQREELAPRLDAALLVGLGLASIVTLLLVGGFSWWTGRKIIEPIRALSSASKSIAGGRYDLTLDVVGDDEIGELVAHFNNMARALHQTEQTRLKLLADVSHELKTPLATMKVYLEGFQDGVIAQDARTLALLHGEVTRLEKLARSISELSQVESHAFTLDCQPREINTIIETAVAYLSPQFDDKGVHLKTDLPPETLMINADHDRMHQVMLNILGNALQYTPSGGRVQISVSHNRDRASIHIIDTGTGIPAEHLPHIFERFYRVDQSRTRATGGTGVGLTIARHLVEAHGGTLTAHSDGQGSEFMISLPILYRTHNQS